MTPAFRVLHVCTGNICRSPVAEHLMRAGLRARLGTLADLVEVSSAGLRAVGARPMEPHALSVLGAYGVDGSAFRARELTSQLVAEADLVLGASREHRAGAVVLQPRASARCFTVREFSRLCALVDADELPDADPPTRARALVGAASAARGRRIPLHPADDDITDPYRRSHAEFSACGAVVEQALRTPLDMLAGLPATASGAPPSVPEDGPVAGPPSTWWSFRRRAAAT